MKRFFTFILGCMTIVFASCSNEDEKGNNDIVVSDQSQLIQTAFADDVEASNSVKFTTKGSWTSAIETNTKSGNTPDWIYITPDRGSKAGDYEIKIILSLNETGADRSANVKINSGDTDIYISIVQKGVKKDEVQVKFIDKIIEWDGSRNKTSQFTYDGKKLTKIKTYETNGSETNVDTEIILSYASNQITYTTKDTYLGSTNSRTTNYTIENNRVLSGRRDVDDYDCDKFVYDAQGRLTKWSQLFKVIYEGGSVDDNEDLVDYTWGSNNISKEEVYYDGETTPVKYVYEYNQESNNKTNLDIMSFITDQSIMTIIGYTGKRCDNLISKITVTGDSTGKDNGTVNYRYEFDEQRYVTKIYAKWTDDPQENLLYEIKYR